MFFSDIEINPLAYAIVNVLISVTTILINIFFICCMFSSQEGPENLQKPPLNVLLGSLIGCNLIINIVNLFFVDGDAVYMPVWISSICFIAVLNASRTSFTASLGLNVFYYFQIVPTRRPFLIWVKMHIKLLMYLMLFFENIFFLFALLWSVFQVDCSGSYVILNSSTAWNSTLNITTHDYQLTDGICYYLIMTDIGLRCIYSFVGIGIMVASNTSTVLYLWRHVRRMEDSSSSSALHYQMQKRVTIMSIIQTLLFFFYSAGIITYAIFFLNNIWFFLFDQMVFSSVAFYCFGITIILGVGQTKFRVRAANILKTIGQAISGSNLNVDDRNGRFNCCYSNTENG
nr:uncharacterized protein LOC129452097 [Misgurnus anguillicaudatus]